MLGETDLNQYDSSGTSPARRKLFGTRSFSLARTKGLLIRNLVGALLGAAIDRRDGDSGVKALSLAQRCRASFASPFRSARHRRGPCSEAKLGSLIGGSNRSGLPARGRIFDRSGGNDVSATVPISSGSIRTNPNSFRKLPTPSPTRGGRSPRRRAARSGCRTRRLRRSYRAN